MRIMVISDIQLPWHHPDAFAFLQEVKNIVKPTRVINIGDLLDNYFASGYLKHPDACSASEEYQQVLYHLKTYFKIFPKGTEIYSNHMARVRKAAARGGIPSFMLRKYRDIFKYPKAWKLAERLVCDNVLYVHGDMKGGQHAAYNHGKELGHSVVIGHHHAFAGIMYFRDVMDRHRFTMNVGSLVDIDSIGMSYARNSLRWPILSTGAVINGEPYLFRMRLDKRGRWAGKVHYV